MILGGAELIVNNAVILATSLGVSQRIIGLTIVAVGTSLPELVTTIISIKKGYQSMGIGNIL